MLVGIWQTVDGHVFDYFTPRAGAKSARTCQRQLAIRPAMPIGMQMASRKAWPGTIETIIQQIPAVTARPTYSRQDSNSSAASSTKSNMTVATPDDC